MVSLYDPCPDISISKADDIWIKSRNHLDKVNKYRKRVGQHPVVLSVNNITELVLLGDTYDNSEC